MHGGMRRGGRAGRAHQEARRRRMFSRTAPAHAATASATLRGAPPPRGVLACG